MKLYYLGGAKIAEDIVALRGDIARAAVYVSAGNRTAGAVVLVLGYRKDKAGGITQRRIIVRAMIPFPYSPAEIAAELAYVNLFPHPLPDISNDQLMAAAAIKRKAIRVAHAQHINFVGPGNTYKRVVGRRCILNCAVRMIDVQAEYLSQQHVYVLSVVRRVIGRAAVTRARIQVSVRAKCNRAAVVIGVHWMRNRDDYSLSGIRYIGIRGDIIFGDLDCAVGLPCIVDEESAVVLIERVKSKPEQSAFAARENSGGDIEEVCSRGSSGLQHTYVARLLDHKKAVAPVVSVCDKHGIRQRGEQVL